MSGATVLLCLLAMVWAAADAENWREAFVLHGQKADYYNLLVDGFLDGHLHMKVQPDASGQLPYLMDASLYQGKYYLYFGVVPAVLLFLPYAWLTGHDLPANAAVLIMVVSGFLFTLGLYRQARRRFFPTIALGLEAACVLLLGFAGGTAILCFDGDFYGVAIAGGYLCFSASLLGLYQATTGDRNRTAWLAWASLWAGLAVGCRPTYLFALPVLLGPVVLAARRQSQVGADGILRLARAGIVPAAIVGLGLAAYNYGRFGQPLEFGFRYQVNELMHSGMPFARPGFVWSNLTWYYLTPPVLGPIFPYVLPIEASIRPRQYYGYELIHGQWLVLLLCALVGLITTGVRWKRARTHVPLGVFNTLTLLAFAAVFSAMLTFGFRANRYYVDFQPILVVGLVLAGGAGCTQLAGLAPTAARLLRRSFIVLSGAIVLFNYLVGIQWMDHLAITRPDAFATLARYGDLPSYGLYRLGLLEFGPLRFRAKFQPVMAGREELLLSIGTSGYKDSFRVVLHPGNRVEFILTNGYDSLRTSLLELDFDREHEFDISIGSLYPPSAHRSFGRWSPAEVQKLKTSAIVRLDGREILHATFFAQSRTPYLTEANPAASPYHQVGTIQRLAADHFRGAKESGLWRFMVTFAPASPAAQPLLGSGTAGAGNLLFVNHVGPDQIRLALDSWNFNLMISEPILLDLTKPHGLEIFVGPQVLRQAWPESREISAPRLQGHARHLLVWLDRRLVWTTEIPGNLDTYDDVTIGGNPQGFSTASILFAGTLQRLPLSPEAKREILQRLPE